MAHSLDTTVLAPNDATTTSNANPVNVSITLNAGATALALGLLYANSANNRTGGSPTAGGFTMSQANAVQKAATSPEGTVECWYLTDPPTGAITVSIPNTATLGLKAVVASFIAAGSGANTSRYDTANGANATSTNPTVSVNTSANGAAVFSVTCDGLANCITGFSNDTGTNIAHFDLGSWGGAAMYALQANSGTQAMGYTANSEDWGAVAVAFKEDVRDRGTVAQTLDDTTITATANAVGAKFNLAASGNIPANANTATTAQLTAPANKTTNDFQGGLISDDTNPLPSVNLAANTYTELEWSISANAAVANAEVYTFRVTISGTEVNTYAANATWTIGTTVSNATVAQTLAETSLVSTGEVTSVATANGTVVQTISDVTQAITGTVAVAADVQQGLADATLSATATVSIVGDVSQTLQDGTIEATASSVVESAADVDQSLESATVISTGAVRVAGAVSHTLTDGALVATGAVGVAGALNQTLANATLSATGSAVVHSLGAYARFPTTANTTSNASPISFGFVAGTNASVVALGVIYAGVTARAGGAPTYGGVAMTQANARQGASEGSAEIWYLLNPPAANAAVSIPNTGAIASKAYIASFVAPAGYISQFDGANGANTTSANPTSSVTATVPGDAIFGVVASGLNTFPANSTNQTGTLLYEEDLGAWGGGAQYLLRGGSGVQSVGWTATTEDWGTVAVAFKLSQQVLATVNHVLGDVTIAATAAGDRPITLYDSSYLSATANSTAQLNPPSGKTANAYFQPGLVSDAQNPLPSIDLTVNCYTEVEWALRLTPNAVNGGTYSFRVTDAGTPITTYSVTPTWVALEPDLATVAQTLTDISLSATAIAQEPGTASVAQTLANVAGDITASAGGVAAVNVTLGNVSQTTLYCDTSGLSGGTPTGYNFYFGRESTIYTQIVSVAYSANLEILLALIAPDTGEWYVMVRPYNAGGESSPSNEVFVVVPTFTVTVEDVAGVADVTQTLGNATFAAAAKVNVTGAVTRTIAAVTPTVTGTVAITAIVSQGLQAVGRSITGSADVGGAVEQTLAAVSCEATGTSALPTLAADVSQTLADTDGQVTAAAYTAGSAAAWVDMVLENALASVDGTVLVQALVEGALADVGCLSATHAGVVPHPESNLLYDGSEIAWRS